MPTETPYTPLQDLEEELAALDSRYAAEAIELPEYEPKRQALTAQIYGIHLRNAKNDLAKQYDREKHYGQMEDDEYYDMMKRIRTARTIEEVKAIADFRTPKK